MSTPEQITPNLIRTAATLCVSGLLVIGLIMIFRPFMIPVVTGGIIALMSRPLYKRLLKTLRFPALAAAVTIILIILIFLLPLALIILAVIREVATLSNSSVSFVSVDHLNNLAHTVLDHFGLGTQNFQIDIRSFIVNLVGQVGDKSTLVLGGLFGGLFYAFLTLVSAFYLMQNHENIKEQVRRFSPLTPHDTNIILKRTKQVIQATVSGNLILLIIQGLGSMLGLTIFGIASPALFGVLYAICSLIPAIGTSIVWVPLSLFELSQGNYVQGIGIAIWAMVQVAIFDNFIGPKLIQKRARLHPFLILLGVLGGVSQLGVLGIILGPTIVALGIVGLEILYRTWQMPHVKSTLADLPGA